VEGSLASSARLRMTRVSGTSTGSTTTIVLASGQAFPDEASATAAGATLGQLTATNVHPNLTGSGLPIAVVGSSDGYLYAVDPCSATLEFAYRFGDPVGEPVFGDTDGDGRDEILVTSADGYLYGIKNEAIAKPSFVDDIDLAHGVTDDIDDINT